MLGLERGGKAAFIQQTLEKARLQKNEEPIR